MVTKAVAMAPTVKETVEEWVGLSIRMFRFKGPCNSLVEWLGYREEPLAKYCIFEYATHDSSRNEHITTISINVVRSPLHCILY